MKDKKIPQKYRGIKLAHIVAVLEGDGSKEYPYENVRYVLEYASVNGVGYLRTVGKITELTEEETKWFDL